MDREHLDRFEALEKRLKAIEDKLMPQSMAELDEITVQVGGGYFPSALKPEGSDD